MRILLDECIDRRLARYLAAHQLATVPQRGWAGFKNGSLMKLAEAEFDVFITVDRNLSFQQDIRRLDLAVIVLSAVSNRYQDLAPFAPRILDSLNDIGPGTVISL